MRARAFMGSRSRLRPGASVSSYIAPRPMAFRELEAGPAGGRALRENRRSSAEAPRASRWRHAMFLRILMERVRQDRHPSATHMAMIEQALPPQLIPDYLEILLEKVAADNNPSTSMLRRIGQLVEAAR